MKITFEFNTTDDQDRDLLFSMLQDLKAAYEQEPEDESPPDEDAYIQAWDQCSMEIILFAVTILQIRDGDSNKGVYAYFSSFKTDNKNNLCGDLSERAISSRVGRTVVVCNKIGNFRLMETGLRRKDQVKRVYLNHDAKEILIKLLKTDWGNAFDNYLLEIGKPANYLQQILDKIG